MNIEQLEQMRARRDKFFRINPRTPLTREQRTNFTGLSYFPPSPALDLTVTVTPFDRRSDVQLQTTQGNPRWFQRYGEFTFEVGGKAARLTLYRSPEHFFLPFVDVLAGDETYPAGRYLEPEQIDETTFHVDFNRAYNPYCAYNPRFDCPITPAENRLSVAIRAGEKLPAGDWVTIEYAHTLDG